MRRVRTRPPSARLPRPLHLVLLVVAAAGVSLFATACGKQAISVPKNDPTYAGAVLFNQHCSGCHSLAAAATYGSAANVRTREYTNGPNFNVRCERPLARILYAIANGGFSGAIMPQNIVVGQDAVEVAQFVAKYSGQAAPVVSGVPPCSQKPIGQVPSFNSATTTSTPATTTSTAPTTTSTTATTPGTSPTGTTTTPSRKPARGGKHTKKASGKSSGG